MLGKWRRDTWCEERKEERREEGLGASGRGRGTETRRGAWEIEERRSMGAWAVAVVVAVVVATVAALGDEAG
jgi:hypothetical protein